MVEKIENRNRPVFMGKIGKKFLEPNIYPQKYHQATLFCGQIIPNIQEQIIQVLESDPDMDEKFPTSFCWAEIPPPPPPNKNKQNYKPTLIGYPAVKSTNEVLANEMYQCISKQSLSQECKDGSILEDILMLFTKIRDQRE